MGTENATDCYSQHFDFIHGLLAADWDAGNFSALYRYTFPETVISNRFIHDERDDFKAQLIMALVYGLRYDVSIYRGRLIDISGQPEYGKFLKQMIDIKEEHREFFYDGKYAGTYDEAEKSDTVIANVFESPDGKQLVAIWNPEKTTETVTVCGESYTLGENEFKLIRL